MYIYWVEVSGAWDNQHITVISPWFCDICDYYRVIFWFPDIDLRNIMCIMLQLCRKLYVAWIKLSSIACLKLTYRNTLDIPIAFFFFSWRAILKCKGSKIWNWKTLQGFVIQEPGLKIEIYSVTCGVLYLCRFDYVMVQYNKT